MIRGFKIFVLILLLCVLSLLPGQASAEENGRHHTGVLLLSPAPQLKWETWKEMLRETGKPGSEIDCRVGMTVSQGQVQSAAMVQSTGFKSADGEICEWVQKTWHFKPEAKGTFTLPIMLHLPKAIPGPDPVKSVAFYTSYPPFAPQVQAATAKGSRPSETRGGSEHGGNGPGVSRPNSSLHGEYEDRHLSRL
jgi:hypothetical protein